MPLERWKGLKYVTLDSPAVAPAKSDSAVPFLPCSSWCPVTSLISMKMSRRPAPSMSPDCYNGWGCEGMCQSISEFASGLASAWDY